MMRLTPLLLAALPALACAPGPADRAADIDRLAATFLIVDGTAPEAQLDPAAHLALLRELLEAAGPGGAAPAAELDGQPAVTVPGGLTVAATIRGGARLRLEVPTPQLFHPQIDDATLDLAIMLGADANQPPTLVGRVDFRFAETPAGQAARERLTLEDEPMLYLWQIQAKDGREPGLEVYTAIPRLEPQPHLDHLDDLPLPAGLDLAQALLVLDLARGLVQD